MMRVGAARRALFARLLFAERLDVIDVATTFVRCVIIIISDDDATMTTTTTTKSLLHSFCAARETNGGDDSQAARRETGRERVGMAAAF